MTDTPFGTMSLNRLMTELASGPPDAPVYISLGTVRPTILRSYRGFYDHLALGYTIGEEWSCLAGELFTSLSQAGARQFEGYKGGTYRMGPETPVWVDNWGDCTSTAIVDVAWLSGRCTIVTRPVSI